MFMSPVVIHRENVSKRQEISVKWAVRSHVYGYLVRCCSKKEETESD